MNHTPIVDLVIEGFESPDGQEFAQMLRTMYVKWAQSQGFQAWEDLDSCRVRIYGATLSDFANEIGVHRFVRQSPHDPENRRLTTWASVDIASDSFAIRSYIMHPYTMVKDHRTGARTHDVHAVFEGHLELIQEQQ